MTEQKTPSKSYRSLVLVLLTVVYGFNFIDRQIVGILAPFIQKDLALTNTELGLLIGLAFATFYTLIAIPIAWLADPQLMEPDADAEYHKIIEIDLNEITEPLLACPNDPDDVKPLSEVQGTKIDEVFIGSCMLNIGNFRAAAEVLKQVDGPLPTKLWIAPPTKMDEHQLTEEGIYNIFGTSGARTEMPGCSLCMGNQARVLAGATVLSTSTRNFPNRLGDGANVYLTSAELASVGGILGRLPTPAEYMEYATKIDSMSDEIYRYMNFDQIESFQKSAEEGKLIAAEQIVEVAGA